MNKGVAHSSHSEDITQIPGFQIEPSLNSETVSLRRSSMTHNTFFTRTKMKGFKSIFPPLSFSRCQLCGLY